MARFIAGHLLGHILGKRAAIGKGPGEERIIMHATAYELAPEKPP
jgi:hypothetical protein